MDLIIRNARLRHQDEMRDVGIRNGKIVAIQDRIKERGAEEIDAQGRLTTPSFINLHVHLDKCLTGERIRTTASKRAGSLDIIPIASQVKRNFTEDDIQRRAVSAVKTALLHGTTMMRAFADVDTIGELTALKSLLKVKERVKEIVDLQVVAFPQEGIIRDAGTEELLYKAMDLGADVIGGMPWYEYTADDCRRHTDIVFEIARRYNKDVHALVDDTEDPEARNIEYLAYKALKERWVGRVCASHCRGALESPNDTYAKKVITLAKRVNMTIVDNAQVCLIAYGRQDKFPIRRSITRVKEFLEGGVNVTTGQDDIDDPYYSFGRGDMLEVAYFMIHSGQFSLPTEIEAVYDMITHNGAKALNLDDYGLEVGKRADVVILNAHDVHEAFRMQAERTHVIKNGKLVAETRCERSVRVDVG